MKEVFWLGTTKRRLKDFPHSAKREAGEQLWRVQQGKEPIDWKPIKTMGRGVAEIRIHQPHEHRVIYVANYPEGVYVLHAFQKKSQQTSWKDLEIARSNYAKIQKTRQNL